MSTIKILTVTEGQSDISILRKVTEHIGAKEGKKVIIRPVAPQLDQTSNTYPRHGWTGVKRWCQNYGFNKPAPNNNLASAAQRKSIKALLLFADYLLIQIDTDIAEQLNDLPKRFDPSKDCRKDYTRKTILSWLGTQAVPSNTYLLLSTHSIENWILATFPPEHGMFQGQPKGFNYEEIPNAEDILANSGIFTTRTSKGKKKLKKSEKDYIGKGELIVKRLNDVKSRCPEFKKFVDESANAIREK